MRDRAPSLQKRILRVSLLLSALGLLAYFAMDMLVRQMLYPAPLVSVPSAPEPLEELAIETAEGDTVVGWLRQRDDGPVALFLHGNGENLATLQWSGLFEEVDRIGVSVLAIDYPGYGRSTGRPSEASLIAAADAALEVLARRFPERRLFVVGWSLGSAVAIQTARRDRRLSGLVLLSPWHDLRSLASRFFPKMLVSLALKDEYDSSTAATELHLPTLVMHGESDRIIPVDHPRRLVDRLPMGSRYVELPGVGHNDLMAQPTVWRELALWLGPASEQR